MAEGLRIDRRFTKQGADPYEGVEWSRRDSRITNPDGSVVFEMTDAELPAGWSQVACDIMVSKYFRKAGVPQEDSDGSPLLDDDGRPVTGPERSARQVFDRLAGTWRWWGEHHGYFASTEDAEAFEDELKYMLAAQIGAPNSPQWFNTGLHWSYGLTGPAQGFWYVDPESEELVSSPDSYSRPSPHACFILSVKDDLVNPGGIMDLWTREARIFKFGSGAGSNFSAIRAENEQLSGGGKSSGVMSFLKIGDRAAGAIKSGGTTRRAAKMVILDVDHPDIEAFIDWKKAEEEKAKLLIRHGGFPADFNGEAYATVSGQNSNNSVRVTNDFVQAVLDDGDWHLTERTTGAVRKTVKARDLWHRIAAAAWACADPGLQFDTTINEWHTCPAGGRIKASNPCSEYMFLDDTACNLASLNLVAFQDPDTGSFDVDAYQHAIRLWTIVLEISVAMAHFPSRKIAQGSYDYRTLGLGYANLGSLLMRSGISYDSDEGRAVAGALTSILTGYAYATSAELAAAVGTFPRFTENREAMLRVMRNHRRAAYDAPAEDYEAVSSQVTGIDAALCPPELVAAARRSWDLALEWGEHYGYRNAQASVLAPTGCLVGGSLVPTERGLVRLRSMGDPFGARWQGLGLSVGTDEGPKEADRFYINGVEPVVSVQTRRGYRIQGTPTHRIKVVGADGSWVWKRFADITTDDLVPLQLDQLVGHPQIVTLPPLGEMHWTGDFSTRVPRTMTPELAELVGYFMGDGSVHAKGLRFCVAAQDFDVVERLQMLGKELFGLEGHLTDRQGYREVAFHSVPLILWWEACGFFKHAPNEEHSGKGWHPHIPDSVLFSNDPEVYRAFLRGLFEADGYVHQQGYPTWSTTTIEFSHDVQSLLLALGYPTTRKFDTTGWGRSRLASIRLVNASYNRRWAQEIGFMGSRKQASIEGSSIRQAARRDYVPVTREMVDRLAPENDGLRQTMLMSLNRVGMVSRRSAIELHERTGDARLGRLLGFFYDHVDTAALGEEEWTYDLSVPENVTYVANGFVSHNTIGLLMDCDTTGVEPDFALVKFKKLAGGGYFKIVNQSVAPALRHFGYSDTQIAEIVAHIVGTSSLDGAPHVNRETLAAKGLSEEEIGRIERTLPSVFELRHAFNVFVVGEAALQRLGFSPDEYTSFDFDLLRALGFDKGQITEANDVICGHQTIEGAPHLADEHLPVFDTANRNGRYGQRFIHHLGHIKMMAAVQPFISGAISKCVTGETLLATAEGLVRIASLRRGEEADTFREEIMEVASLGGSRKTDAFYYGGSRQVRTVTLRSGHRITGTPNHRLLVAGESGLEWRHLADIRPGEHVATRYGTDLWSPLPARFDDFTPSDAYGSQKAVTVPAEMSDDLAFLLGAIAAEGHISRRNWTVVVTNSDETVLERVSGIWQRIFGVAAPIRRPHDRCPSVQVSAKTIVEFLDHLGVGDRAATKRIPDAILRSPRSMVLAFLSGLFLDGYVTTGGSTKMGITVASARLMDDLQAVLTNLGVVHGRSTKVNRSTGGTYHDVYAAGPWAQTLARLVPFAERAKAERVAGLLARDFSQSTADVVPGVSGPELYEMLPLDRADLGGRSERLRFSFLLDPRTLHVSRRTLERVAMVPGAELPEWLYQVLADRLHFSPVTEVADAGEREVYDISVPDTHAFVGNGIVNHNTINMPNEVTPEDIEEAYALSWKLGLKAMALYRDGSKAAQPLNSTSDDASSEEETDEVTRAHERDKQVLWGKIPAGMSPTQAYAQGMHPPRFLLPARRHGWTQEARVGGHKLYLRTGEYDDGTLGELFIDLAKEGATLRGILSCFAIAVSKGLQFGVPLSEFVDTFTFQTFEPRGMVEGHPNIKMANSIVDYVFRALAVEYLHRDELAQVPPDRESDLPEPPSGLAVEAGVQLDLTDAVAERDVDAVKRAADFVDAPTKPAGEPAAPVANGARAKAAVAAADAGTLAMQSALGEMMGDAPLCDTCGHITVRNGSCYKCLNCGNSLGCS